MYESPIEVIYGQVQMNFEDNVMKAVQNYGINVNKDALVSALMYDRNQYEKGYKDGIADYLTALFDKNFIESEYGIVDIDRQFLALVNPSMMISKYAAYKEKLIDD